METKTINFGETLKDALVIGLKNAPSLIAAVLLWIVTIWIPYLNVGTTIAISLLPTELAKGNVINPFGIFDSKYRRYMGEYLLTVALMALGTYLAMLFLLIPGIVLSIAWSLSVYYLIEKNKNPMEAIKASNDATYGSKWAMFGITLLFVIAAFVVFFIVSMICGMINSGFVTAVLMILLIALLASVSMAISASFWRQLKDNVARSEGLHMIRMA